jgi:hypothetical protein
MQDPICAMKICRDMNGFSSVTEYAQNSARLGNMSTAAWLTHRFTICVRRRRLFTAHATTSGRNSALVSTAVAVQWSEHVSTYVCYDGQPGRDNYDQLQCQRRTTGQFLKKAFCKLAWLCDLTKAYCSRNRISKESL